MPKPLCTDDEFIELWRTHKSAADVSKALKCSERSVHQRRRRIETRTGIPLEGDDKRARFYKYLQVQEHSTRQSLELSKGQVVVFSDAHFWPGVRTTAFRALVKFIEQMKPAAVINNGDAFDGASISRHPRINWSYTPSVMEELKACQEHLGEIEEAAGKKTKLLWALGNHDSRFESRLSANVPEFANVHGMRLQDHFPAWKPCWSVFINNSVVVKHRMRGGVHATHNNTVNAGVTMVTGHLHSLKVTPFDDYNGTRWGVDTGTLADPRGPQFRDYLEDSPTNWRSGFVVLSFHNGQLLWPEIVRVVDEHHVDFRGSLVKVDD